MHQSQGFAVHAFKASKAGWRAQRPSAYLSLQPSGARKIEMQIPEDQWTEVAVHSCSHVRQGTHAPGLPNLADLEAGKMLQPDGQTYGAIGGSEQRKGQGPLLCVLLIFEQR